MLAYICLVFADVIYDSLTSEVRNFSGSEVFVDVKLDVALLKVVIVYAHTSWDRLASDINDPRWDPFSTPVALEV